jgi:MFS family permease
MKKTVPVSHLVFVIGASLTVIGVIFFGALEKHSFESTQDLLYVVLEVTFPLALLIGALLAIIGAVIDRRRMDVAKTRRRGVLCWLAAGVSCVLFATIGNVHSWTISFFFPAITGLLCGAIYLTKFNDLSKPKEDSQR